MEMHLAWHTKFSSSASTHFQDDGGCEASSMGAMQLVKFSFSVVLSTEKALVESTWVDKEKAGILDSTELPPSGTQP